MPYEDLISAVKAGAQERIKEIQERAQAEALKIRKDAEERHRAPARHTLRRQPGV